MNGDNVIYFDGFWVEHITKENKKFVGNANVTTNILRKQTYDSVMCRYFCIEFIEFMLKGKRFLEYTKLFSPKKYEKNDKIMLKYLQ